jgi:hypothetical protein
VGFGLYLLGQSGNLSYQKEEDITMKAKKGREKLSVSMPNQMAEWLQKEADRNMTSVSAIIQRVLFVKMNEEIEQKKKGLIR